MTIRRFLLVGAPTLMLVLLAAASADADGPATRDPVTGAATAGPLAVAVASPTPSVPLATMPPLPSPIAHPGDGSSTGCVDCHAKIDPKQAQISDLWGASAHAKEGIGCADCHGGDPTADELTVGMATSAGFLGVPSRSQTVGICGGCHSSAERMRPYGLNTDQYSKYYSSVHGQQLLTERDSRVAICIDCHGSHDVKKVSDSTAKVYPLNIPSLCASCHADAARMQPYGIPTDQFEVYKGSVHGQALLVDQDLRAPSCVSCHGSHSAKPPRSDEVVAVCGKCHTATQALYEQSVHSRVEAVGPKCWTCHGTHDVSLTNERLLLHEGDVPDYVCATCHSPVDQSLRLEFQRFDNPADRRCDTCHHPSSLIYSQVDAIATALGGAAHAYDGAEGRISEAAGLGMITADAEVAATEARTALIQARASVHTTKLPVISKLTDETVAKAAAAEGLAQAKLDESLFRREAMVVVIAIILVNILMLVGIRRRLERPSG
jgi:hypothetical protein